MRLRFAFCVCLPSRSLLLQLNPSSNIRAAPSDTPYTQRSKRSRRSKSPRNQTRAASPKNSNSRSTRPADLRAVFRDGAQGTRSPAVCAVCLGRNKHSFIECTVERLWDGTSPTVATRVNKQLLVRGSEKPLCVDWQRARCISQSHDDRHICSGCLATTHGAQNCSRAQTTSSDLTV